MRFVHALPLIAGLALAACNSGDSVVAENESAESVAKKVAATNIKPQPGRWEAKVKIENLEMAGMPAEAKAAMQKQMAEHSFASCLTSADIDKPEGGFFGGGADDCVYKRFVMAGGTIDAEMTCGKDASKQDMTLSGSYSETSYDIKVTSKGEIEMGKPMSMSMSASAKRVGECTGKDEI